MNKPKRTEEANRDISTARTMPTTWKSGTGASPDCCDADAERPTPSAPGAPNKLPGYGGGR